MEITEEHIRLAWQTGRLSYKLRNGQKLIRQKWITNQLNNQKFYLECSRRFGKSTFLLIILSEDCIKNPGHKCGFYAPVKEGLRDYVLPLIQKVFEDCPEDLKPKLDSHLTLNFKNGSTIIFRGSNNEQHRIRRGNDLNLAGIDEARDCDRLDDLIESVVIPSLFTSTGHLIISSTPADSQDHPLYMYKQQAEKEGWYVKFTMYDANKWDPIDFPLTRIDQWKKETTDPIAWQREYLAEWVRDSTKTVVPEFSNKIVEEVERDEFFHFYHKYVSLDSGVRDKTVALFGYYDFNQAKLIIVDEFVLQNEDVRTDKIAKLVKEKERTSMFSKVYRRVADCNNLILVNDLNSEHQLDFFGTKKDTLEAMINQVRLCPA